MVKGALAFISQERASTIENVVIAKTKLAKVAFMSHDKASTIKNELIVGSALAIPAVLIQDNASANENVSIGGAKSMKEAKVSQGSIVGGVRTNPCLMPRPKIIVVVSALVGIDGKVGSGSSSSTSNVGAD